MHSWVRRALWPRQYDRSSYFNERFLAGLDGVVLDDGIDDPLFATSFHALVTVPGEAERQSGRGSCQD